MPDECLCTGHQTRTFTLPCTDLGSEDGGGDHIVYPGEKSHFCLGRLLDLKFRSIFLAPYHISWWILIVIIIVTTRVNPNGSLHFNSHTSHQHFSALNTHCRGNLIHHSDIKKILPIFVFTRNSVQSKGKKCHCIESLSRCTYSKLWIQLKTVY